MLKAMEPTDAAINIVKFNKSVIVAVVTLLVVWNAPRSRSGRPK